MTVNLGLKGCKNSEVHLGSFLVLLLSISQIQIFLDLCQKCPHEPSFIHSSPNPLSLLSKHPTSFPILTSQTRILAFCTGSPRAPIHLQCVVLLYSSNLIPPRPFRSIYSLPSTCSFTWDVITPEGQLNRSPLIHCQPFNRPGVHGGAQATRPPFCSPTNPGRSLTL